ncbi:MAG TPA: hypothetical protein VGL42_05145 [Opitutaceae bacterium]|jgi:hypothetical protein
MTLTNDQITTLQSNLHASIANTKQSASQCPDSTQTAQLADKAEQMADQECDLETQLFSHQTLEVSAAAGDAFDGAHGFTQQLSAMSSSLDKYSKIMDLAGKVIEAATKLLQLLP